MTTGEPGLVYNSLLDIFRALLMSYYVLILLLCNVFFQNEVSSSAVAQSQPTLTETNDQTERNDQTDGTTSQTRLTGQAGRSGSSAVTVSHIHHGSQQRSVTVSAGNEERSRTATHSTRGQGQGQRSTTTEGTSITLGSTNSLVHKHFLFLLTPRYVHVVIYNYRGPQCCYFKHTCTPYLCIQSVVVLVQLE